MQSKSFSTVNPATGERIASYSVYTAERSLEVARNSQLAFAKWSRVPIAERQDHLKSLARVLRSKVATYSKIVTLEMGKPITQAEAEVEKCAWASEFFAENAGSWLEDEAAKTDAKEALVAFEPLGVILSVMPWNFPFWQALRFAIPALAAGNTALLRHSNVCPGSALAIQEAFGEAGFPEGVFSAVITDHETVGSLIDSEYVAGVSLTGSTEAGKEIAERAARNLKKVVLELGGSDPFVVFDDADLERAAQFGANARLQNSGQSCICAKRFIVDKRVAKEYAERLAGEFEKKKMGDPTDRSTDVGPLVNQDAVDTVHEQVKEAIGGGAIARTGGKPRAPGFYYEPTVLDKVTRAMRVMDEEVFGPVAPIYAVNDEEEAVRVANDTEFGLGASVWTHDRQKAERVARQIQSGLVFVNQLTKSDPRVPFGGVKKSGIGRELSKYGLREFVNVKTIGFY